MDLEKSARQYITAVGSQWWRRRLFALPDESFVRGSNATGCRPSRFWGPAGRYGCSMRREKVVALQVWALRNLSSEIDRFSKENARLEETEERLTEEIDKLQSSKRKLSQQSQQLESTVTELTHVSEGLQVSMDTILHKGHAHDQRHCLE